jgi:hypothetical protein
VKTVPDHRRARGKDAQIREVAAELEARMDEFRTTVEALQSILTGSRTPPDDTGERLVKPA